MRQWTRSRGVAVGGSHPFQEACGGGKREHRNKKFFYCKTRKKQPRCGYVLGPPFRLPHSGGKRGHEDARFCAQHPACAGGCNWFTRPKAKKGPGGCFCRRAIKWRGRQKTPPPACRARAAGPAVSRDISCLFLPRKAQQLVPELRPGGDQIAIF